MRYDRNVTIVCDSKKEVTDQRRVCRMIDVLLVRRTSKDMKKLETTDDEA